MKIARAEALESGMIFYFTGKPCKRGHFSKRRTSNCMCYECELIANTEQAGYKKQWYEKNKEKILHKASSAYSENRSKKIAYASEYQRKNLDRIARRRKQRMNDDPVYAIKERVRCLIKECIRNSGTSKVNKTAEILGCSGAELRKHIERQFLIGMNWDNRDKWHIDHIIPISSAKTEEDVIALNHFTNLRPLWATDNLRKSNRMECLI